MRKKFYVNAINYKNAFALIFYNTPDNKRYIITFIIRLE